MVFSLQKRLPNHKQCYLIYFLFSFVLLFCKSAEANSRLTFDISGTFTWLTAQGICCFGTPLKSEISGTLQFDTETHYGTLTINPFIHNAEQTSFTPLAISPASSNLLIGFTNSFAWSGNSNMPVSIVWDATGLVDYVEVGEFNISDFVAGGVLPFANDFWSDFPPPLGLPIIGPSLLATTTWDTTGGGLPLIADTAGGSPMLSPPFPGSNVNIDLTALTLTTIIPLPKFENVAPALNITTTGTGTGNGHGLAWIDFNNDGWDDLYIVAGSGEPNRLYENINGTSFQLVVNSGAELVSSPGTGVTIADYDGDGWDDIFVTNAIISSDPGDIANSKNSLLKNNQNNTFTDVSVSLGIATEEKSSYTAAFADIDKDGDLDLYVGHWGAMPLGNDFYKNLLIENGGVPGFQREDLEIDDAYNTFTALMTDYDSDDDLDLYLINDFGETRMFDNDGVNANGDNIFTLSAVTTGLNINSAPPPSISGGLIAMGAATADINHDGLLDYHISGFCAGNVLMQNDGANQFINVTPFDFSIEFRLGTCWGAAFADVDNDGDADLYVGSNEFPNNPASSNHLAINDGTGLFSFVEETGANVDPGYGIARADFDHDGRIDFAVLGRVNGLDQIELLRNITPFSGNHWISIRLVGDQANTRGIGAKVRVTSTSAAGSITQMQELYAGSSHGSTHSFAMHFGFPMGSVIDQLKIEWPNDVVQILTDVTLDQVISVPESADTDGDGLSDVDEVNIHMTNPSNTDTDGDAVNDGDEVTAGTNPINSNSFPGDGDINVDGQVNAADVILAFRIVSNLLIPNQTQITHGDIAPLLVGVPAPNGVVDSSDLMLIIRKVTIGQLN